MNTSVDTSTNAALRELTRRPPPGISHEAIRLYDTTLDDDDHWRRWSTRILTQVRHYLKYTRQPSILVLAGARYVDGWAPRRGRSA